MVQTRAQSRAYAKWQTSLAAYPSVQEALVLRAPYQPYELVTEWPLPRLENPNEVLLRIEAIGLNPVDWKCADFNFALPTLPAINGRDLAGTVVAVGASVTRFRVGDRVFGPSTQYRDYRTSAFQSFAISNEHCLGFVPQGGTVEQCAAIGVGAVTAALAIGSALGIAIRHFAPRELAIGAEGEEPSWTIQSRKRDGTYSPTVGPNVHVGEYLLIWGGSTVTGFFAAQFARLANLRVIAVADETRHGARLRSIGVEHVVSRDSPSTAVDTIKRLTGNRLRYAIDCVGRESATSCLQALSDELGLQSWLVGLAGLPKVSREGVSLCEVPVKTFHSNASVGTKLMGLIEELLREGGLVLPDIEVIEGGLAAVNGGLDRLRQGEVGFGRLVIRTPHE